MPSEFDCAARHKPIWTVIGLILTGMLVAVTFSISAARTASEVERAGAVRQETLRNVEQMIQEVRGDVKNLLREKSK